MVLNGGHLIMNSKISVPEPVLQVLLQFPIRDCPQLSAQGMLTARDVPFLKGIGLNYIELGSGIKESGFPVPLKEIWQLL